MNHMELPHKLHFEESCFFAYTDFRTGKLCSRVDIKTLVSSNGSDNKELAWDLYVIVGNGFFVSCSGLSHTGD